MIIEDIEDIENIENIDNGSNDGCSDRKYMYAICLTLFSSFFYSLQYLDVKLVSNNTNNTNKDNDNNDNDNNNTPLLTILFLRGIVGTCTSLLFILLFRLFYGYSIFHFQSSSVLPLSLRGILGCLSIYCSFHAVHFLPLSVASVFTSLTPIWTAIYSHLYQENNILPFPRWTKKHWFVNILCLWGVIILSVPYWQEENSNTSKPSQGIIYALFSSLFQSGVNISIVQMKEEHTLVNSFYSMGMTTLLSLCWWKTTRSSLVFYISFGNIRTSIFMYSMGFLSLLAQSLRTSALQISNSLPLTTFRYLDIPLAFLWDSVIFHYTFSIYEIIGISIILIALILKLCMFQ